MKNILSMNLSLFALLTLSTSAALAAPRVTVEVKEGYVRSVPADSENTSAYMTFINHSKKKITLQKATSPSARAVELHEHLHENGTMKMVHLKSIDIPAEGTAVLEPMGRHIMLIGLKKEFTGAKFVQMTFIFSDGSKQTQTIPVQKDES